MGAVTYRLGLPHEQLDAASELYDEAFGQKLALAVRNRDARISLLRASFVPDFAFCAMFEGEVIGLAGFHTPSGSLTGGVNVQGLLAHLGFFAGLWAAGVFSLYERKPEEGELLMDGVAVRSDMRGRGVGGQLLDDVVSYARQHSYDYVRLDVIDINDGARRLYERKGFEVVKTEHVAFLRPVLGFGASTTMRLSVA